MHVTLLKEKNRNVCYNTISKISTKIYYQIYKNETHLSLKEKNQN